MTEDEVEKSIEVLGLKGFHADLQRAGITTSELTFYQIWNTANRPQFVLAKSPRIARALSCYSDHLKGFTNGRCAEVNDDFFHDNPGFGSAVKRAVRAGRQGVVDRKGEHAIIGDSIFAPISLIE